MRYQNKAEQSPTVWEVNNRSTEQQSRGDLRAHGRTNREGEVLK